jgi:hypothetical protein
VSFPNALKGVEEISETAGKYSNAIIYKGIFSKKYYEEDLKKP